MSLRCAAAVLRQVEQSVQVSLKQLHTPYLDSLVLHSPLETHADTMRVWRVFEAYHAKGTARQLGISNTSFPQLADLLRDAVVPPAVVQNRFYTDTGRSCARFGRGIRARLHHRGQAARSAAGTVWNFWGGGGCEDSKNSQTTSATTSTSSIRQLLGAADTQMAHHVTFSTVPTRQLLGSANAETTPGRAPAAAADRK